MSDDIKDIDKDLIKGHEYDGIKELDNPLPGWWKMTFYATILFGAIYYYYYELGDGPTLSEELAVSMNDIKSAHEKVISEAPKAAEVDFAALMADADAVARGKQHYVKVGCNACHGMNGEGVIGPNLTDKHWIYGKGSYVVIAEKISEGILDKGMPPHKDRLKPQEVNELTAYVKSLVGTNPANAKAPQGELVE